LGPSGGGTGTIDASGTSQINAVIGQSGGPGNLVKTGASVLTLAAANTYTGTTSVNLGTLKLDFSAGLAGTPSSNILYNGVTPGTLILGGAATALAYTANSPNTATLQVTGIPNTTNSQSFGGVTLNQGNNAISASAGSFGSMNLALGTVTHNAAGLVAFTLPASGAINVSNSNTNGILGAWATVGTNWATVSGGAIAAYSGYTTVAGGGTISSGATQNIKFTGLGNVSLATTNTTTDINTFQFTESSTQSRLFSFGGTTSILRLGASGGFWRTSTSNNATLFIGAAAPGAAAGKLTAGGAANTAGEIVFNAGGTGLPNSEIFVVFSVVADNGSSSFPVTVTKTGLQSMTLEAANTYSGGTYINQGRITANSSTAFGTGTVNVQPGGQAFLAGASYANNFVISGSGTSENNGFGAIRMSSVAGGQTLGTSSSTITLSGDARIGTDSGSNAMTIAAKITGAFNLELAAGSNNAATSFILTNTGNDFSGNLGINAGNLGAGQTASVLNSNSVTVKLGAAGIIPHGAGKGNVVMGGGSTSGQNASLDLNGFDATVNGLGSTGGNVSKIRVTNSSATPATLTLGDGDATATFMGIIQDGAGTIALNKIGNGVQTLVGPSTYTGGTTVTNGTLVIGFPEGLSDTAPVAINGGTLTVANETVGAVTLSSGAIINGQLTAASFSVQSGTVTAMLAGSGNLTKTTNGTVALTGNALYTGTTTISAGTLVSGSAFGNGQGLAAGGGGPVVLGDANTTANNSSPTLLLDFPNSIPRSVTIADQPTSGTYTIAGGLDLGTGISGLVTINQNVTISQVATSSGNAFSLTGGITSGNAGVKTVTFAGPGAFSIATNGISDGGTGKVAILITSGQITLSAASTYTGGTTIGGGTLTLGQSDVLPNTGAVTASGGTLDIGANSDTVGAVTLISGSITGTTGKLTGSSFEEQSGTITARLAGAANFTKTTGATATLAGGSALYNGTTEIQAGKLILTSSGALGDNGTGSLGLTVAAGATLASSGPEATIIMAPGADVVIAGTLAPGDIGGHGAFDFTFEGGNKLRFDPGSVLALDLDLQDRISVSPNGDWLTGSGNLTLALNGAIDYAQTYTIFSRVTTPDFALAGITGFDSADYTANFTFDGTSSYTLSFTAVPEPGSAIGLLSGLVMLAGCSRFRRRPAIHRLHSCLGR
jgi:autotransporter-associated beta strand protein